jgi:hypothetical protein
MLQLNCNVLTLLYSSFSRVSSVGSYWTAMASIGREGKTFHLIKQASLSALRREKH